MTTARMVSRTVLSSLVFAVTIFVLPPPVVAYRRWMRSFPNAGLVPCPGNSFGCHGTNICEASGHSSCIAHGDSGGVASDFGALFAQAMGVRGAVQPAA